MLATFPCWVKHRGQKQLHKEEVVWAHGSRRRFQNGGAAEAGPWAGVSAAMCRTQNRN